MLSYYYSTLTRTADSLIVNKEVDLLQEQMKKVRKIPSSNITLSDVLYNHGFTIYDPSLYFEWDAKITPGFNQNISLGLLKYFFDSSPKFFSYLSVVLGCNAKKNFYYGFSIACELPLQTEIRLSTIEYIQSNVPYPFLLKGSINGIAKSSFILGIAISAFRFNFLIHANSSLNSYGLPLLGIAHVLSKRTQVLIRIAVDLRIAKMFNSLYNATKAYIIEIQENIVENNIKEKTPLKEVELKL